MHTVCNIVFDRGFNQEEYTSCLFVLPLMEPTSYLYSPQERPLIHTCRIVFCNSACLKNLIKKPEDCVEQSFETIFVSGRMLFLTRSEFPI